MLMIFKLASFIFIIKTIAADSDIDASDSEIEKSGLCKHLNYCESNNSSACGIRVEGEGFKLKLFENECELLRYSCQVDKRYAYELTESYYCEKSFSGQKSSEVIKQNKLDNEMLNKEPHSVKKKECVKFDCSYPTDDVQTCAITVDGEGYRVRLFHNKCEMIDFNCQHDATFVATEFHICSNINLPDQENSRKSGLKIPENLQKDFDEKDPQNLQIGLEIDKNPPIDKNHPNVNHFLKRKNVVIIDGSMLEFKENINKTIENFFASTHEMELPLEEVATDHLNDTTRRMLMKIAGPVTVFRPWIIKPDNVSEDQMHMPTLSSCYHRCPTKCPSTYAPVCGVPGIVALEPSLMFQNHCFMDAAQCKMKWEDKSDTAISSYYIESSFVLCLGDEMNNLFRFLPLVRTLQHMGRLKMKGNFKYKFRNMKFFNNRISVKDPKIMG